jgi:hypothetical protein
MDHHAGEWMIDVSYWPELFLMAIGLLSMTGCIAAVEGPRRVF